MKNTFKKISAVVGSVLMVGMTMGVAAAANYPAPFVVGGSADAAIVYGTGVGVNPSDLVQAGYIQTNLAASTSSSGGGGSSEGKSKGASFAPSLYEPLNFSLGVDEYTFSLAYEESKEEELVITNELGKKQDFSLEVKGVSSVLTLSEEEFTLDPYESKTVVLHAVSDREPGVHVGSIMVESDYETKQVPVVVEVSSQLVLFDASLFIPSLYKTVTPGGTLATEITLFNVGSPRTVDVLLNYRVLSLDGEVVLEESETVAVQDQTSFNKEFYLPQDLEDGSYVLGLEVVYVNSVAVSSSTFDVVRETAVQAVPESESNMLVVGVLIMVLLMVLTIGLWIIFRREEESDEV